MAEIFSSNEWQAIADRVKEQRLDREMLLTALPSAVQDDLPRKDKPGLQIDSDIYELNGWGLIEGILPIERWLRGAARQTVRDTEAKDFFIERADEALKRKPLQPFAGSPTAKAVQAAETLVQERVLWRNDLLPISFLIGAARTAQGVARIAVKRHQNGVVLTSPATGLPLTYFGTAWLIGPKHAITNHHVIAARVGGEQASAIDLEQQALTAKIEFDFDDPNQQTVIRSCARLLAFDAQLDFAVIELADVALPFKREALPLSSQALTINPDTYLPVNIVQHPGGQAKQIAIRNNAALAIEGNNLKYITDTEPGSSGSPVCNDQWQVVALHKASTRRMGVTIYEGRESEWVNIGTPITLIVQALKERGAWDAIGASTV